MPTTPRIPRRDPADLPNAERCWVCGQLEDEERAYATLQIDKLVGHAAYAICPRCRQEAPDLDDSSYRHRADRYLGSFES